MKLGINLEEPRRRWHGLDSKKPSRAIIACDGNGNGVVLTAVGERLRIEIEEHGLRHLSDLGLDDAPQGISVWEGTYVWSPGPFECPEDGCCNAVGTFRVPTDEELRAARDGHNPWPGYDVEEETDR